MNEIEPALRKADETQAKFNQLVESMTTDTLGRAENDTIQEELELVAARRAQPEREPLTSQQVWENHEIMSVNAMLMEDLMRIVRAVEAAHGITQKDAG